MVTTVFRTDSEQDIIWPQAEATEKIDEKRDDILNIWLTPGGEVFINDQELTMDQVRPIVAPLYASSDQRLVVSIRSDRDVPYRLVDEMQEQLKAAGVVRVVFATELEQRMTRARRGPLNLYPTEATVSSRPKKRPTTGSRRAGSRGSGAE